MTLPCENPAESAIPSFHNNNLSPSISYPPPHNPSTVLPQHTHHHHHHRKRDSKVSLASKSSTKSHQEYIDSLEVPSAAIVQRIDAVQVRKEKEMIKKRLGESHSEMNESEREKAAGIIQRNYRGHRERRIMDGMSLDPSTRWVEAIKEAQYRNLTTPRARGSVDGVPRQSVDTVHTHAPDSHMNARHNWKKIGFIAKRAGGDEDSESESSGGEDEASPEERERIHKQKIEAKAVRQKAAKMMDLQYFLEMVDLKHRYGSNLRTYHEEWKKSDTNENFFYWLDYGEGRFIDCQGCPRERLDKECVRYLSKEERLDYLVKIDNEGRLCWAKNGARIDTTEQYKDSIHGIVPATDFETPVFRYAEGEAATGLQDHDHGREHHNREQHNESSDESDSESEMEDTDARANKYTTPELDNARGMKKVKHVSAATIFNKLLRGSVKKNTWIFVADTSFRLYVGIKQSGAFQHSSFLHGSRISAAGLIKIKNGRLSKLSPLSGHYRPPVSNFRAFIHSLKDTNCDMSHVSISRSYAVLVGLEAYVKTRKRSKKFINNILHKKDKVLDPEKFAKREEEERDKSESAERERRWLEMKEEAEKEEREESRRDLRILRKLSIVSRHGRHGSGEDGIGMRGERELEGEKDYGVQVPGTGPENAIAPEGTRNA